MEESDSLQHYSSPYYDPVKAHEYYMRTRELKGRRSTSSLNDDGKKIWQYTKQQISSKKKEKTKEAQEAQKRHIEQLRANAAERKERISEKLKLLNERLSENAKRGRERISDKAKREQEKISEQQQAKIDKLRSQPIPHNLSSQARKKLIEQRNMEIAKIRGDAKVQSQGISANATEQRSAISDKTTTQRRANSANAAKQRQEVATNLKNAIAAARAAYTRSKTDRNQSYEQLFQTEYDKIKSEYLNTKRRQTN